MIQRLLVCLCVVMLLPAVVPSEAAAAKKTSREALQAFQDLIGSWKGTGTPAGSREVRDRGFWQETISWQWQFKGKDSWLRADLDKGKHYTKLELHYLPDSDGYKLDATTPDKQTHTYTGKLDAKRLTLERSDAKTKEVHRLVFSLLHSNRYLYRAEKRQAEHTSFSQVYQVGCTKQGVAFATEDKGPECIVSGGKGTMAVTYKGKTYYVCCSGCRDAFKEEPEKYIKEFEEAQKKKKD
jgi:YHS domain-containing protein